MQKLVALGDFAPGHRFCVRDPQHVVPPGKRIAPSLEVRGIQVSRDRADHGGERHPRDTGHLENSLIIGAERLDLGLDHLAQAFRDLQIDTREGTSQLPCPVGSLDEPSCAQVLEHGDHEQRIPLRMAVDQCRQPGGNVRRGGIGAEILDHLRFAERRDRQLVAEMPSQQIRLENRQGMT